MVSVVRMVSVVGVVRMHHLKKGNTCPLVANRTIVFPFGERKIFCPDKNSGGISMFLLNGLIV